MQNGTPTRVFILMLLLISGTPGRQAWAADRQQEPDPQTAAAIQSYGPTVSNILQAAQSTNFAHARLAQLCDSFGPRITGSENLEKASAWILTQMKQDGLQNVRGEPVQVPHWVRGPESAELIQPRRQRLRVLAVGGSVSTPAGGITAPVLVVRHLAELRQRADEARERIVLFNVPFTDYGSTVAIRTQGAIEAAKVGAVASLIRSVTPVSLQTPHTGMMRYDDRLPRIPHGALSLEDAAMLQRMQDRGQRVELNLQLESRQLPEATSHNLIGELVGREHPEQIVLVSGHIDSWDVGQGAMDDAGGCLMAWEAVRLIKQLGLRPRRTLRVVLWTGEETGSWGAKAYREQHRQELTNHVLAIEADAGTFAPQGFAFSGSPQATRQLRAITSLLEPIQAHHLSGGTGGMDVIELYRAGVPAMDLKVENSRYFWFHHSEADTVDKIDPGDLNRCIAAEAVAAYLVADLPERLPR